MSERDAPAVEVRGLMRRFGEVQALAGVDLTVEPGTVLGLLGPNGAGKTTVVRILSTVLTPDAGTARVLGLDVVREPSAVRATIGLAGQYAAVDANLTGRENLYLVGRLAHLSRRRAARRAGELLERFRLTDAADRRAGTYSGGMRRRLDLAAALVHEPPVLFLDEPTTGLDPTSRSELWDTVRELVAEGRTVLLTTQYLDEADQLADRIVVIDRGTVIAEGTQSELKSRLGATVVELGLPGEAEAAAAAAALAGLGDVSRHDAVVQLGVRDGTTALLAAVRTLDAAGIPPAGAAVREPSLDDVFLALTGHRASEEDGAGPDPLPEEVAA